MNIDKNHFMAITDEVINYFQFMAGSGCQGIDCSDESLNILQTWRKDTQDRPSPGRSSPKIKTSPKSLLTIHRDLGECRRCKLSKSRVNVVFGEGNPSARLFFVAQSPGREEDNTGTPFTGEAGQLLTRIIENGMKLKREDVYLSYILKCRPPGDRDPEPDEIRACLFFFKRQLMAIKPDFLCTLGEPATQTLLKTKDPISDLRGHFYEYMGMKLMPLFGPEYLIQHPEKKRETWEDIKLLIKEMKEWRRQPDLNR